MKKVLALILILVLAFSLAACGGSSSGSSSGSSDSSGAADAVKDSITIALDSDYQTLHPANWTTSIEHNIDNQIYDTLVAVDLENPGELTGKIAESWEISDDACCYTFHLRDGITFHNGEPLTAADVEFSLDLYAASEAQAGDVDGYDHCEIVDDHTIKVYTVSAFAPFLNNLTLVNIGSKAYFESASEEDFAQKPIGCGPYVFVNHNEGDTVTLDAYENYYLGTPSIKHITFKIISDMSSMSIGIQSGSIDFAEIEAPVRSTLEQAPGVKVETAEQTTFSFVAMNTEKEPFNDVKFRQAVNYALNRSDIIDAVMDGAAEENSNLLAKNRFGYSDSQKQYSYDPEKAKELLAECGYADGLDLGTFIVADQYKLLAQMVQDNLKAVGLTCELEVLEFNAYLSKLMQGDFGMTCLNMSLEGDTQNVSMAVTKGFIGMANNARWYNDQVEEWFREAVVTVDEDARAAIYNDIFSLIQDEAVYAVIANPIMLFARNENLTIHDLPLEGNYYVYYFHW
ncbi:MAG: ABC transporter substrate-binding protein [Firmicutes bacterium]|nr:ABC transporter substrate-binding protein [Bacillota bacterium]